MPESVLLKKLAAVIAAMKPVPLDGHNEHFGYNYTSEQAVLEAVRGELAKRDVVLFPSVVEVQQRVVKTGKDRDTTVTLLVVEYTIEDGDSGETRKFQVVGEGADALDKGASKAYTAAAKSGLQKLFLMVREEEGQQGKGSSRPAADPLVARRKALWAAAQRAGITEDGFRVLVRQQLGQVKASKDFTADDLGKLETAVRAHAVANQAQMAAGSAQ